MKKYHVYWTHEATIDLQEIIEYISLERISVAKIIYEQIKSKCFSLYTSPERYRIVPELNKIGFTQYREIIYIPYRIIYKVTTQDIFVIAVIDGRRDFEDFIFHRLIRHK